MKKHGILNSDISRVLSYMGHTDRICIGDCGLPIPDETERIDLAVKFGVPTFMDVLKEVGDDMKIEKIVLAEEIKEKTYTFSGLESNVIYNIKVRVEKDGKAVEKEVSTITGELPEGAVQFSPVEWKSGQASTTITTSETGYTLQYQIGGIAEESWTNTTSGSVIGNLQHGQIVYGRLFDGTNGSKTANIDVQDLEEPKVNVTAGEITTNSITVSVGSSDEQWGMPTTPTYNYYIKKSIEGNYPTIANYTGTNTNYTFTGLTQGTKYDVKIIFCVSKYNFFNVFLYVEIFFPS